MVSAPYRAMSSFQRVEISSTASSQEMEANFPSPFSPVRRRGVRMRWGLFTAWGRWRILPHIPPRV